MSIKTVGSSNSSSRKLLQQLVDEIDVDAKIAWGRNNNKFTQLTILKEHGVVVPRFNTEG